METPAYIKGYLEAAEKHSKPDGTPACPATVARLRHKELLAAIKGLHKSIRRRDYWFAVVIGFCIAIIAILRTP